eukprot:CAMPEP_0182592430 /NCGR_PEP_ID=MMETSP1324-20130603/75923_1 /TAXON_ID=236786 /ORGANISM="Florenciella sp., Strain RCC1587" /LENGTH=79 /DNA_ID=CAMNT_0024809823 /DNA_START=107 /DNA_END=344 /DNA_ORIENTATION=+
MARERRAADGPASLGRLSSAHDAPRDLEPWHVARDMRVHATSQLEPGIAAFRLDDQRMSTINSLYEVIDNDATYDADHA